MRLVEGVLDPLSSLALLSAAFLVARLLSRFVSRTGAPGIVIELVVGFLLGAFVASPTQAGSILGAAELGVLTLFFAVGLETDLASILPYRKPVLRIATLSVTVSALGFLALSQFFGLKAGEPLFVAATLMTSGTGMAVRLLRDHNAVATPSGRILIGSSVLDDFPAIFLLALAFGLHQGHGASGELLQSGLLHGGGLLLIGIVTLILHRIHYRFEVPVTWVLPTLVLGAWISHQFGLTALLGALLVGLAFRRFRGHEMLEDYLRPLSSFLIPLYFITVGMRVPLDALLDPSAWGLGVALFVLALLGRMVCLQGLGRDGKALGADPWLVMWGMVPRGMPGLVFATMAHEAGAIQTRTFFALILMVTLSNLIGLTGMALRLRHPSLKLSAIR